MVKSFIREALWPSLEGCFSLLRMKGALLLFGAIIRGCCEVMGELGSCPSSCGILSKSWEIGFIVSRGKLSWLFWIHMIFYLWFTPESFFTLGAWKHNRWSITVFYMIAPDMTVQHMHRVKSFITFTAVNNSLRGSMGMGFVKTKKGFSDQTKPQMLQAIQIFAATVT